MLDTASDRGVKTSSYSNLPTHEKLKKYMRVVLYPWQVDFIKDPSILKLLLKSRQAGGSYVCAFDDANTAILSRPRHIVQVSASQKQANELGKKTLEQLVGLEEMVYGEIAKPLKTLTEKIIIGRDIDKPQTCTEIHMLSSSSTASRGFTGYFTMDEAAIFQQAKQMFTALQGLLARGYRGKVSSTPFGDTGLFYDLISRHSACPLCGVYSAVVVWDTPSRQYICHECKDKRGKAKKSDTISTLHKVDIHKAVGQGMSDINGYRIDINRIRAVCLDEETFQQEYECQFLSDEGALFSPELCISCCRKEIPHHIERLAERGMMELEPWPQRGLTVAGIDLGRVRDRTVVFILRQDDDGHYYKEVMEVMKNTEFSVQAARVRQLLDAAKFTRVCVDRGGLGRQFAEDLTRHYGSSKVIEFDFTRESKIDLMHTLKRKMQAGFLHLGEIGDIDTRDLINDLRSIKRIITPARHMTYDAPADDKGHADRAWALALAVTAGEMSGYFTAPTMAGSQEAAAVLGL